MLTKRLAYCTSSSVLFPRNGKNAALRKRAVMARMVQKRKTSTAPQCLTLQPRLSSGDISNLNPPKMRRKKTIFGTCLGLAVRQLKR